jgi:hypothetical protein
MPVQVMFVLIVFIICLFCITALTMRDYFKPGVLNPERDHSNLVQLMSHIHNFSLSMSIRRFSNACLGYVCPNCVYYPSFLHHNI